MNTEPVRIKSDTTRAAKLSMKKFRYLKTPSTVRQPADANGEQDLPCGPAGTLDCDRKTPTHTVVANRKVRKSIRHHPAKICRCNQIWLGSALYKLGLVQ